MGKNKVRQRKTITVISDKKLPVSGPQQAKNLILFDNKVRIFLGLCTFMFLIFTFLKLHNSSIPKWNEIVLDGGEQDRGLLSGKPLNIRADEWHVYTSFFLAQNAKGNPVKNETLGFGNTPLAMGLPANHISSYIRPNFWGFFLLDIETGFSWYWNFKIFPFIAISFLFFMLFTRNQFWLSLAGSLWLYLSSAIQWWSINTELFTYGLILLISAIYLLYSRKIFEMILASFFLVIGGFSFIMILYPAYQVPLAYLLLSLFAGYLIKNRKSLVENNKGLWIKKSLVLLPVVLLLGFLSYRFFVDTKETIKVIADTVYPGKRNEAGGDFQAGKFFSDNFHFYVNEYNFPVSWNNASELASYLMLFPYVLILTAFAWYKKIKPDPLILSVSICLILFMTWLFIGFPSFLAKLSLLNVSPPYRTFYILGFANVILSVLFISSGLSSGLLKRKTDILIIGFAVVCWSAFICFFTNGKAESFFSSSQVLTSILLFALVSFAFIFFKTYKWAKFLFGAGLIIWLFPSFSVNPVSQGLSPYLENSLFTTFQKINSQDPGKKWLVFGDYTYANYLKAAGVNCFNGVQFAPQLSVMRILDPLKRADSIYNRYAHIHCGSFINGTDSVAFKLYYPDFYGIGMDPCSPRLDSIGISYILFTSKPQDVEVRCMTPVYTGQVFIYKRNIP